MKNYAKKSLKTSNGITLIALVITIIVLLILAGISISMLSGDNGILQRATDAKTQTGIGQEKEIVALAYNSALAKKVGNGDITPINDSDLRNELSSYSEIDNVEMNNEDIVVTFKSNRSYLVKSNGEISKQNNINISGLVVKNGNTVVVEGSKSVAPNTPLTINFTAEITEGSITSISPTIPYTTNGTETSKTFTITGTGGITEQYTVNLKGYYNIPDLKVGDFVNYALKNPTQAELDKLNGDIATYSGATGNTTKTAEGSTLLCRVLEIDENTGNPTKLISADGVNTLKLEGANGYNNAVYLINEMCKTLYSGNQGTTESLTIEDLENNYFEPTALATAKDNGDGTGEKFRYTGAYSKYPLLATREKRMGINTNTEMVDGNTFNILNTLNTALDLSEQERSDLESGGGTTTNATNGITVTRTYYLISSSDGSYKNATLNNIIHRCPGPLWDTSQCSPYWLASRAVYRLQQWATFNIRYVNSDNITMASLFYSSGSNRSPEPYGVRPIITLNSGVQAEYVAKYSDNSAYNIWSLN